MEIRAVLINSEDCARVLGFANAQEMIQSDAVLDIVNQQVKNTGVFPIITMLN